MEKPQTLRTGGIAASRDYQDLPAWSKAMNLAERIYALSEDFPEREYTGLSAQLRASVIKVASFIAAGSAKNNENGIIESYSESQGAAAELNTQLTLATRLGYIGADNAASITADLDEVSRLLIGLKHGLKVAQKEAERAERDAAKAAKEAAEAARPARREYKPRDGEERPRREYKPRDSAGGEDRPRREYKPRDDSRGERPSRSEYKPREDRGGEGAPRAYKPRTEGGSKSYGDKKPYGDRKPYGDKKPYGDRKPSGGTGKPRSFKPRD